MNSEQRPAPDKCLTSAIPPAEQHPARLNLLLIISAGSGHHISSYLRQVLVEASRRGWDIHLLLTPEAYDHPSFQSLMANSNHRLPVDVTRPFGPRLNSLANRSPLALQAMHYLSLRRAGKRLRTDAFDVAFALSLDYFAKAAALLGNPLVGVPLVGMLTRAPTLESRNIPRQPFVWRAKATLGRRMVYRLARNPTVKAIAVVDRRFFQALKDSDLLKERFHLVPEAGLVSELPSQRNAREHLGISGESTVILVYGNISLRKGVRELLNAASRRARPSVAILLAGELDMPTKAFVEGPVGQQLVTNKTLIVRSHFHSPPEEAIAFAATDYVWLGYPGRYMSSSGVLIQAINARRPLLATDVGIVGETVTANGLGITFDPDSPTEVDAALSKALSLSHHDRMCMTENLNLLARQADAGAFGVAICDVIQRAVDDAEISPGDGNSAEARPPEA